MDRGSFAFEILDWAVNYSFTSSPGRFAAGTYEEYLDLTLTARFVAPAKHAGALVTLMIAGRREGDALLEHPQRPGPPTPIVGTLTVRGEHRQFLGALPTSAVWGLVAALGAGKLGAVTMSGTALSRGTARIDWLRFSHALDPDDL